MRRRAPIAVSVVLAVSAFASRPSDLDERQLAAPAES